VLITKSKKWHLLKDVPQGVAHSEWTSTNAMEKYLLLAYIVAKVTFYVLQLHNQHVDHILRIKKE